MRAVLTDTPLSAVLRVFSLVPVLFSILIGGLGERLGNTLNKFIGQNKHFGSKAIENDLDKVVE